MKKRKNCYNRKKGEKRFITISASPRKEENVMKIGQFFRNSLYAFLFAALMLYGGGETISVFAASSNFGSTDCILHEWSAEYSVDQEATCTASGWESIHCTLCGAIQEGSERVISPFGHLYQGTVFQPATTTEHGIYQNICENCDEVKTKSIAKVKKISLSTVSYTYNGSVKTPKVTVEDVEGHLLKKNTDYKVAYAQGRKNAGTYSVTVTLRGNYSGKIIKTFQIQKAVQKIAASSKKMTAGGNSAAIGAKRTVGNGSLQYQSSNRDIVVVSSSGKLTPKSAGKATITITAKETTNYKKAVKKITVTVNPPKTEIRSLQSKKNGQITVTWNTKSKVNGYQIRYAKSSSMDHAAVKTITKSTTSTKTITNLAKGSRYYVQIRTYKTVSGTKYYSSWSTTKQVVVQKKSTNRAYVWLSATGSKYHTIPNCGNMNPNKAIKVTKSSAEASGYQKCKNCH